MIAHVDMDAFFASVEQLDDPTLRGRPVIVGGGTRGVVATASYEARAYGIHSAMPAVTARRLCPQAVFVRPRFARYKELSGRVMEALWEFGTRVEVASIDEAYLDVSGMGRSFRSLPDLVCALRARVREVTGGLTCSVGAAPVKFLAKICSDMNKPDGVFLLAPGDMDAFLLAMDVRRIPGVGRATAGRLAQFGIHTCADARRFSEAFWRANFGRWGLAIRERAFGIDPRGVEVEREQLSESAETTFVEDVTDRALLLRRLLALSEEVGARLRRDGRGGRTVTLKLKYADFRQVTRSLTLGHAVSSTQGIYDTGRQLLDRAALEGAVRLIGIGVSHLDAKAGVAAEDEAAPHSGRSRRGGTGRSGRGAKLLLPGIELGAGRRERERARSRAGEEKARRLDAALDALRERFGGSIITRGSLLEEAAAQRREEANDEDWWKRDDTSSS